MIVVVVALVAGVVVAAAVVDWRERRARGGRGTGVNPDVAELRRDISAGACQQFPRGKAAGWTDRSRKRR